MGSRAARVGGGKKKLGDDPELYAVFEIADRKGMLIGEFMKTCPEHEFEAWIAFYNERAARDGNG